MDMHILTLEETIRESIKVLESTASELRCMIDMKNADLERDTNSQSEFQPEYFDAQTAHEAMMMANKMRIILNEIN